MNNASNYEFPADIIFQKIPQELKEKGEWLPTSWDIRQEDCLYIWLKDMYERMKRFIDTSETFKMDKEDFQIPRLGSKRKSYEREEQENDKQRPYERKEEEKEDKSRERRKKFMLAWLSSFPEYVGNRID